MKIGLVLLLLLFGWTLKAPPLPPPPNRAAGVTTNPPMYFTNASHGVIAAPSPVPTRPNFNQPTAGDFGKINPAVHPNTPVQLGANPAQKAALCKDCIGLFGTGGILLLYVLWALHRGTIFMVSSRHIRFVERKQDAYGYWLRLVAYLVIIALLFSVAIKLLR
ncbi:MAG: hypothetical protein P4N60_12730 [Verrucomicrobiae bacterium]|nr:hypothetical protein [Verrucomicrobiae bacterium]